MVSEHRWRSRVRCGLPAVLALLCVAGGPAAAGEYVQWQAEGLAIPEPLGGLKGDPERGRELAVARDKGNCLACHPMPVPEHSDHGTIGPPLHGVADRLDAGQLRLRVVDEKQINPETIMPGFYRHPRHFNRPLSGRNRTLLTAQEVEDVVAYLMTLKEGQ